MDTGGLIDFDGKKYIVDRGSSSCPAAKEFNKFREEIEKNIDEKLIPSLKDHDQKLKLLANKLNKLLEPINDINYALRIIFTGNKKIMRYE